MSASETQTPPAHEEDYYQVLGVDYDATTEQIRAAYRDLVRQYHPDAGLVGGTTLLFRRIQEAYEVLRDADRRQRYDEELRSAGLRPSPLLDMDVMLGPTRLACLDQMQLAYALIRITPVSSEQKARTPLNLCLVLDRSTSMKNERLAAAREATLSLVEQLEADDQFALVTFSDRAEVRVPAQQKPDKRTLRMELNMIQAGGGTEIYQGLAAGLDEARRVASERRINHIILLTDGHTYGDAEKCLALAKQAAKEGIGISGIGVGNDWNEDFLDVLASAGGGTVMYIERSANIGAAFERKLRNLKDAWIPDMTLDLRYDPVARHKDLFSVAPELIRIETTADGTPFSLGPLQRSEARVLLLEMLVSPQPEGMHRLCQLEVRGSVPALGQVAKCRRAVRAEFLPAGQTRPLIPQPIIEAAQRVSLLRASERARWEVQQGMIGPARARLDELAAILLQQGETDWAQALQSEAAELANTGHFSESGTKRLRYATRTLPLLGA